MQIPEIPAQRKDLACRFLSFKRKIVSADRRYLSIDPKKNSRQYLSIDPKINVHAHSNAHNA